MNRFEKDVIKGLLRKTGLRMEDLFFKKAKKISSAPIGRGFSIKRLVALDTGL